MDRRPRPVADACEAAWWTVFAASRAFGSRQAAVKDCDRAARAGQAIESPVQRLAPVQQAGLVQHLEVVADGRAGRGRSPGSGHTRTLRRPRGSTSRRRPTVGSRGRDQHGHHGRFGPPTWTAPVDRASRAGPRGPSTRERRRLCDARVDQVQSAEARRQSFVLGSRSGIRSDHFGGRRRRSRPCDRRHGSHRHHGGSAPRRSRGPPVGAGTGTRGWTGSSCGGTALGYGTGRSGVGEPAGHRIRQGHRTAMTDRELAHRRPCRPGRRRSRQVRR